MSSLHAHLERHDLAASPLDFRRDCPLCRAERVQGRLPTASLLPPRARAAMAAAVLASGAVTPGAVAAGDGQGVAAPAPASPPPPQVSDVGVGGGGAAPIDRDHGAQQEPHEADDLGSEGDFRPNEGARETDPDSGAVAPGTGGSGSGPAGPEGRDRSADSGDAATVQRAPAAEPSRGDAPAARPDAPDHPAGTPGPAPAPAPAQHETPPAPAQPDTVHASPTPGPSTARAGGQTGGPQGPGGSARQPAFTPGLGASSDFGGSARGERGGLRRERDRDRTSGRDGRATQSGEPLAVDATATGPDRAARRAEREGTEQPATYRVRPGDSLWRIAERRLGPDATATATAREVTRLWELNRHRIGTGNPDLIFPGQTLRM